MHVESLEALHFRNLERLSLTLSPKTLLVVGPNAQGKTNLLEALYLAATGKSFRAASPRDMLRHDADRGHVKARFSRHGVRHEVEVELSAAHRTLRVDGRGVKSSARLLELVNVVAFFPDDLHIVKGSPERRRRFLDRAVANHRPEFVAAALAYGRALRSRNALLKAGRTDRALLAVYDKQLVEHGTTMQRCRHETVEALAPLAAARFGEVMDRRLEVRIGLVSGLGGRASPDEVRADFPAAFLAALDRTTAADRARGLTHVGPHRADLELALSGREAQRFGSQGQQRALVLALKLAEVTYLRQRLGSPPVLLLDDVSSELDAERTAMLFEAVTSLATQVWVSSTGSAALPLPADTQVLRLTGGVLHDGSG